MVGVASLTVLPISVPHLIGNEGWLTGARAGEKFLYVALVAYLGASVLYGSSVALRQAELLQGAVLLSRAGLLLHTTAIVARWVSSGHAPLSDIYEMVLVFSWAVVALHTLAEWRLKLPFLGAITLPIASLALILMQVLPGEIRPLVPALQSTWLQIHVTLAMLSYAGFTISFAVALLYLIKDGVTPRNFLTWCAALVVGVYGTIVAHFREWRHGADHDRLGPGGASEGHDCRAQGVDGAARIAGLALRHCPGAGGRHPGS